MDAYADRLTPASPEAQVARVVEQSIRTKLYYSTDPGDGRGYRHRLQGFALQGGAALVEWECQDYVDPLLAALRIAPERMSGATAIMKKKYAQIDVVNILETMGRDFVKLYGFPGPFRSAELRGTFHGAPVIRALFPASTIARAVGEMDGDARWTETIFGGAERCWLAPPFDTPTLDMDKVDLPEP